MIGISPVCALAKGNRRDGSIVVVFKCANAVEAHNWMGQPGLGTYK